MSEGAESISPTAHYTGEVWARNGLSHPGLRTAQGRVLYASLQPVMAVSQQVFGVSLEPFLLARHRAIDRLLATAIDDGRIGQVLEVAAGMSPRGWRFAERYGSSLTYVETDLPGMTARKRRALAQIGSLSEHHRVEELDGTRESGPASLGAVVAGLDPGQGLAIITEGLLNYLPQDGVVRMWKRFASALSGFTCGRYYSDLHVGDIETGYTRAFRVALSGFVRGRVELHFGSAAEAEQCLRVCGFDAAAVRRADRLVPDAAAGAGLVDVIEASIS